MHPQIQKSYERFLSGVKEFRLRPWLSNLKWLVLSFEHGILWRRVSNWLELLIYYAFPISKRALRISFRNGYIINVPRSYIFEAIAETQILNVYCFPSTLDAATVVDVGASVGDFVLFVQSARHVRVHAFEPDSELFKWLSLNVNSNRLERVMAYNLPVSESLLRSICDESGVTGVDFMKVDCEGCEYSMLFWSPDIFRNINRLALETHNVPGHTPSELSAFLKQLGFQVVQRTKRGRGSYLFASRRRHV